MRALKQEVKRYLAWLSVKNDSEDLNLDAAQNRETDNHLRRSDETVGLRVNEAYCWLLVPYIDREADIKKITWDVMRISGGSDSIAAKAAKKMEQNEMLITAWAPALLLMELDRALWGDEDSISVKKLWDYFCTYCYLPRLAGYGVLEDTIRNGLNSTEYYALAAGISGERYIDLKYHQRVDVIETSAYLVKSMAARRQIAGDDAKEQAETEGTSYCADLQGGLPPAAPQPSQPKNMRFHMSARLDHTRISCDVQKLVEEVISHLTGMDGATVEVTLEVAADAPEGMPQATVRTVSENCQTLKVSHFGFE